MQLWSARCKMAGLPDYSNTGLSVLAGVTVGIPVRLDRRRDDEQRAISASRAARSLRRDPSRSWGGSSRRGPSPRHLL